LLSLQQYFNYHLLSQQFRYHLFIFSFSSHWSFVGMIRNSVKFMFRSIAKGLCFSYKTFCFFCLVQIKICFFSHLICFIVCCHIYVKSYLESVIMLFSWVGCYLVFWMVIYWKYSLQSHKWHFGVAVIEVNHSNFSCILLFIC